MNYKGREKELFLRWTQLGAFNPLMENGGGGEHRPWMYDGETTEIYRQFVDIHYQLVYHFISYFLSLNYIYINQQNIFV